MDEEKFNRKEWRTIIILFIMIGLITLLINIYGNFIPA